MRPTHWLAAATGLAVALGASSAAVQASDVPDTFFYPGDTVTGDVDFAGDVDLAVFEGLKGMKLRVVVTPTTVGKAGAVVPVPRVTVSDAWDRSLGPRKQPKAGKPGTARLAAGGTHTLRIAGVGTMTGGYTIATGAILPPTAKSRKAKVRPNADLVGTASIDLLAGATLDAVITPGKGVTDLVPPTMSDENGHTYDLAPWLTTDEETGVMTVTGFRAATTGTWTLTLEGFASKKQTATVAFTPTQPIGDKVRRLEECLVDPAAVPDVTSMTYTIDSGLTLDVPGLGVTTLFGTTPFGAGSATADSLQPDVTQIAFLSDGSGNPFAPIVVRPGDAGAPVVVTVRRIALGIVGLHPWVARLGSAEREQFFDAAPNAASFPFLESAVRSALAEDPDALFDPAVYPEVFRAGDKAATETLALLGWGSSKRTFPTPWGDFEEPATFAVYGTTTGHAVMVNPRYVFYGVEESGPGHRMRLHLVQPRGGRLGGDATHVPDPYAEAADVLAGRTDFAADAFAASDDLSTPGGLGTAANGLNAILHVVDLSTPLPLTPPELTGLILERYRTLGLTPADQTFFTELSQIPWGGTPAQIVGSLETFLTENNGANWRRIAADVWRWSPPTLSGPFFAGPTRYLRGYLTVADMSAAMPFVVDVFRTAGEPELDSCVTRKGFDVTPGCPPPFTFAPDFTSTPSVPSVGEQVLFDPSATAFSAIPPVAPTYRWTFWDAPGAAPVTVDSGVSSAPVPFTFSTSGFHLVTLDVAVGDASGRAYHSVQVESLPNLGFELGDMSFWTVETHTWFDTTPGSQTSHSAIMTPGFDPIAPALPTVFHGNYSLRIEDQYWGGYISSATRTLQVPAGGMILKFAWAAVLEDPQHSPWEQPYFDIKVHDNTTGEDLYAIHHYSNEPGYPWNDAQGGSWKWVPWQPVTLDLTGRDGHDIVISAIAADCEPTGHGGYVYFDAP